MAAAIALAMLPALAGAAQIGDEPDGYYTESGQSHTVLIGATVEHSPAGTALGINPGGYEAPYGSTFINRGTIKSTGELHNIGSDINAYGVHLGSEDGQSDLTGSFTNQAGASITVDVTQSYQEVDLGDGKYGYTNEANALANGYGVSMGNVMGTLANHGTIGVSIGNETTHSGAIGLQVGGIGENNSITNSSTGSITAMAGSNYEAGAKGIELNGNADGTITNAGVIGATAMGNGYAEAYGIQMIPDGDGALGDLHANLTNAKGAKIEAVAVAFGASGSLSGSFSDAAGILLSGNVSEGVTLTNDGEITAGASVSGVADGGSRALAGGIVVEGALDGTIATGAESKITVSAEQLYGYGAATATGIYVGDGMAQTGSLINGGQIEVTADADGREAYAAGVVFTGEDGGNVAGSLTNDGSIVASASAAGAVFMDDEYGMSLATAHGIQVEGALTGTIANNGKIEVTAQAQGEDYGYSYGEDVAYASGIGVGGAGPLTMMMDKGMPNGVADFSGTISNGADATIDVTAEAGRVAVAEGISVAMAGFGIDGYEGFDGTNSFSGSITNDGNILVDATATEGLAYATGINARIDGFEGGSIDFTGEIANNGKIVVSAQSGEDYGYGYGEDVAYASGIAVGGAGPMAVMMGEGMPNGVADFSGTISNGADATIDVTAKAGSVAVAEGISVAMAGFGIDGYEGANSFSGSIVNEGDILVSATSQDYATATGISIDGYEGEVSFTGTITNGLGATISVTATGDEADAEGIYLNGDVGANGSITNDGTITVLADASLGEDVYSAEAHGIYVSGDLAGNLSNSGTIDVTAKLGNGYYDGNGVQAVGIEINDDMVASATLTNDGSITVTATSVTGGYYGTEATGILVDGDLGEDAVLTHNGDITASASMSGITLGEDSAIARGIHMDSDYNGTVITGEDSSITVTATQDAGIGKASATGIYIEDDMSASSTLTNGGAITATATQAGGGEGYAAGIHIDNGSMAGTLVNNGSITATAVSAAGFANAAGIVAEQFESGTITNNGTISGNAEGLFSATAHGIYISGDVAMNEYGDITSVEGGDIRGDILNGADGVIKVTAGTNGYGEHEHTDEYSTYTVGGHAYAAGIGANGSLSGSLINEGLIDVFAGSAHEGGMATANAIDIAGSVNILTNNGILKATAVTGTPDLLGEDTESDDANATGIAIGGIAAHGAVVNGADATITVSATANDDDADAIGIEVDGDVFGSLTNDGTITVTATGEESAEATGIDIYSSVGNFQVATNKAISATASSTQDNADAFGINVEIDGYEGSGSFSGYIANGEGATIIASASSAESEAYAAGINVFIDGYEGNSSFSGAIINGEDAAITVTATGQEYATATGISIDGYEGEVSFTGTIANGLGATISVTATGEEADAEGIYLYGDVQADGSITNDGTITVVADANLGEDASAEAHGIYVSGDLAGKLSNSGAIDVTAKVSNGYYGDGAQAVGIEIDDDMLAYAQLTNDGSITVTATSVNGSGYYGTEATGILVDGDLGEDAVLSNDGDITVTATGEEADADGIYLYGDVASGASVTNGGTITVLADASHGEDVSAEAHGIYVEGSLAGNLSNTGVIDVTAKISDGYYGDDAQAVGIEIDEDMLAHAQLTNDGSITVTATSVNGGYYGAQATGILVGGEVLASAAIVNANTITVTATATDDDASAAGILVDGFEGYSTGFSGTIVNGEDATISVTATAEGYASAIGIGVGIDGFEGNSSFSGTIINSNEITVAATSGEDYAYASGIHAMIDGFEGNSSFSGTIINGPGATLTVSADAPEFANAVGVAIDGGEGGGIDFSGQVANQEGAIIKVTANAEADGGEGFAYAAGISAGQSGGLLAIVDGGEGGLANFSGKIANAEGAKIDVTATAEGFAAAEGISVGMSGFDGISIGFAGFDSNFGFDGNNSFSGSIVNGGEILVNANVNEGLAYASGVNVRIDGFEGGGVDFTGEIANQEGGKIEVNAQADGGEGYAYASGVSVGGIGAMVGEGFPGGVANFSGTISNGKDAIIDVTATANGYAIAEGVSAGVLAFESNSAFSGSIVNDGKIRASANANEGLAYASGVSARIDGFEGGAEFTGEIANHEGGKIEVNAQADGGEGFAYASGISVGSYEDSIGILSMDGFDGGGISFTGAIANELGATIKVAAMGEDAAATGIYIGANVGSGGTVTNDGTITVEAKGDHANASGIVLGQLGDAIEYGSVENSVSSQSVMPQTPAPIFASLSNSKTIEATATGGDASAYGISVNGLVASGATITNTGSITAKATGEGPFGAYAAGVVVDTLDGSIVNSGKIVGVTNAESAAGYSIRAYSGSGSIDNQAGGLLQGHLYAGGTINVDNAGTIALTENDAKPAAGGKGFIAHGYVGGNYTQSGELRIGAYGTGNADTHSDLTSLGEDKSVREYSTLTVEGDVEINGKAFVDVREGNTSVTKLAVGKKLDNVVAVGGNLIGTGFTAVEDNSFLFKFVNRVDEDGNIDFDILRDGSVTQSADSDRNRSGRGAAMVYDKIIDNNLATGDMVNVIDALDQLNSDEQVSNAVSQSSPLVSGQGSQSVMSGLNSVNKIVQSRQEGQLGRSSGDSFMGDNKFWFKPFGSKADQGSRDGAIGYDSTSYGMVFGADAVLSDVNRIGFAFAYAKTDVDSDSAIARQKADIDSYNVVMYGSHSLTDATDLSFQADVGYHKTDGTRRITFGGLDRTAEASYDSWSAHFGVGLAHTLKLSESTSFTPSVRADYTHIKADSYRESGADALNLNVGSSTADALVLGVDGKVAHAVTDKATLVANVGVGYDVLNERSSVTSTFAGDTTSSAFVTKGVDPSPWLTRGGFGVVGKITETTEITARYDIEVRDEFTNQTASVKLRWSF